MSGLLSDDELLELVKERQLRAQGRDTSQAEIDKLNTQIGTELVLRGVKTLDVGEWRVSQSQVHKETLDEKALLNAGVSTEILAKCKVPSTYSQLRVSRRVG